MDAKDLLIDALQVDLAVAEAERLDAYGNALTWRAIAKQGIEELAALTTRCRQLERRIADLRESRRAVREAA